MAPYLFPSLTELPELPGNEVPETDPERLILPPFMDPELDLQAADALWCSRDLALTVEDAKGVVQTITGREEAGETIRFAGFSDLVMPAGKVTVRIHRQRAALSAMLVSDRPRWVENGQTLLWPIECAGPPVPVSAEVLHWQEQGRYRLENSAQAETLNQRLPPMFNDYHLTELSPTGWIRKGTVIFGTISGGGLDALPILAQFPPEVTNARLSNLAYQSELAIMIHGLRACKESWLPYMSVLASMGIASVAVDLPGHGARTFNDGFICGSSEPLAFWSGFNPYAVRSRLLDAATEQSSLIASLSAVRKAEGLPAPGIVSHSLGTLVAVRSLQLSPPVRAVVFTAPTGDLMRLWEQFLPPGIPLVTRLHRLRMTRLYAPFDMRQLADSSIPLLLQVMAADKTVGTGSAWVAAAAMDFRMLDSWKPRAAVGNRLPDLLTSPYPSRILDSLAGGDHLSPLISRVYGNEGSLLALEAAEWLTQQHLYLDPGSPLAGQLLAAIAAGLPHP